MSSVDPVASRCHQPTWPSADSVASRRDRQPTSPVAPTPTDVDWIRRNTESLNLSSANRYEMSLSDIGRLRLTSAPFVTAKSRKKGGGRVCRLSQKRKCDERDANSRKAKIAAKSDSSETTRNSSEKNRQNASKRKSKNRRHGGKPRRTRDTAENRGTPATRRERRTHPEVSPEDRGRRSPCTYSTWLVRPCTRTRPALQTHLKSSILMMDIPSIGLSERRRGGAPPGGAPSVGRREGETSAWTNRRADSLSLRISF